MSHNAATGLGLHLGSARLAAPAKQFLCNDPLTHNPCSPRKHHNNRKVDHGGDGSKLNAEMEKVGVFEA